MSTTTKNTPKSNWFVQTMGSTLGRKLLMALTGLFLILFLTVHLAGNLQLLLPFLFGEDPAGKSFNEYAAFMGHNEIIQLISIGNFFFIILHIIVSIILTRYNQSARPVQYAYSQPNANSNWKSRNMMVLGTLVLIFIVVHLVNFWGKMKLTHLFGQDYVRYIEYEGGHKVLNLYAETLIAFKDWWLVGIYVACMIALSFHLSHGFSSAFQTLGLNHKKYTPFIKTLGAIYAVLVPLLFALIPIILYIQQQ